MINSTASREDRLKPSASVYIRASRISFILKRRRSSCAMVVMSHMVSVFKGQWSVHEEETNAWHRKSHNRNGVASRVGTAERVVSLLQYHENLLFVQRAHTGCKS